MINRHVSLSGKWVVITGAGGGIGEAATSALTAKGAIVTGVDSRDIPGVLHADVRDQEGLTVAMKEAAEQMGGIDILINNAGIGRAHDAGDFPDDAARMVMDVNFFGAWNATAAALPYLLERRGQVVNVSSGLVKIDLPYAAAYSASKRALAAYSAALEIEYKDRLAVTTLYPGYIKTSIHDIPTASGVGLDGLIRPDSLEEAAAAIVKVCMSRARSATTSRRTATELWLAGRFPRSTERVMSSRMRRWARGKPAPSFLRYPDDRFDA